MPVFYESNVNINKTSSCLYKNNMKIRNVSSKEKGHLHLLFNYFYHRELNVLIGIHSFPNGFYEIDCIDIYTGLSLPICNRRHKTARNHLLRGLKVFSAIGEFKPLDIELWNIIKIKRGVLCYQNK